MAHAVLNLSYESNTLSNHIASIVKKDVEKKKAAVVASVQNISNIELSKDEK